MALPEEIHRLLAAYHDMLWQQDSPEAVAEFERLLSEAAAIHKCPEALLKVGIRQRLRPWCKANNLPYPPTRPEA